MPSGQIDDDTAEIDPCGKRILINTDVLVDGVHFSDKTTSGEDVGWKVVTSNLSDLAASGVDQILGITVGLIAPANTPWQWVEDVYLGIDQALTKYGGTLIGGDCSKGHQKSLSVTAIGTLSQLRLHRSNARAGDFLIATGAHGLSRLGLALLLSKPKINQTQLTSTLRSLAIKAHQRPEPPLDALKALIHCKPEKLPWRAAGTDSSDGLLEAIQSICVSSHCQAVIDSEKLPKSPQWPLGSTWDKWCLNGGEDFKLILSLPPLWASAFEEAWPSSYVIGLIQEGSPKVIWKNGKDIEINDPLEFKHY